MIKSIKKSKFAKGFPVVLFLGIMFLGFFLRFHNINTWPRKGATFDEYAWTWQGMNIIQSGVPVSWSPHAQYVDAKPIIYQQTHFRIVKPFLEHPPLFGIAAGGFAIMNGASDMYHLELAQIRPLALILGTISISLVFILVRNLYGLRVGMLSGLLYATIPTVVIGSRIVQNENFFIPIWLCILIYTERYIQKKRVLYRNIAILLCCVLILAKIPWIAAGLSVFAIFLFYKKYRDAFYVFCAIILGLLAFTFYGYFYDWNLFVALSKLQTARYDIGFTSIFALFQKPFLVDRYYADGWIYFGWFSFILLLTKDIKKNLFIIAPLLSYFLIFLAGIPDEAGHGWYRYPFYPFLVISISLFLKEYFAKNFLLTFFFLVFIGTSLFGNTWEKVFGFSYFIFRLAIVTWLFILLPNFSLFKKTTKFGKVISYFWFITFISMNIWAVLIYNEQ